MRATKEKTEVRQDQIAKAALQLVLRHGWRKVSIAAVARKVGVVPSAIYRHYQSKNEVVDAVLDLVGRQLLANVHAARQEGGGALEQLRSLLDRHVRLVVAELPIPRIIFSEETFVGSSLRRRKAHQLLQDYLDGIADIIRNGEKEGLIRAAITPEALSVIFLGIIQPAAILWVVSDGKFDIERQTHTAWEVFRQAIQND